MKLAIITSQFPELHETFILREFLALYDSGIDMKIYSMKPCKDRIVHEESKRLLPITEYMLWNDPKVWLVAIKEIIFHPIRSLKNLMTTIQYHHESPVEFAKGLITWFQAAAFSNAMRSDNTGHVHAHWATIPTTSAVLVSQSLNIPFSFTAHAWDIFVKNPSLQAKTRLAKKVITCTEYNLRHLQDLYDDQKDKIILNYHGVDLEKFDIHSLNQQEKSDNLCLSVGRLVEQKGYEDLIDAYGILKKRNITFQAIIIGDGPLKQDLLDRINRHELKDMVKISSSVSQEELRELYRKATLFALPSVVASNGDRDGIPNVILEALAMSIPVVSTTVSGIPEAVESGFSGFLSPERSPDHLAKGLEELLSNNELAKTHGRNARKTAETKFSSVDHMVSLVKTMRELLPS